MSTSRLPRPRLCAVALLGSCLALTLRLPVPAGAQFICTTPPTGARWEAWKQGASIQVNIDPAYNSDQRNAIAAAFENWNNSNLLASRRFG